MTPTRVPTDEQLVRYLRGECSGSESVAIHGWLAEKVSHAQRLERLRGLIDPAERIEWNVDPMWSAIRSATIDTRQSRPVVSAASRRVARLAFAVYWWRGLVAASLLIALAGVGAWIGRGDRTRVSTSVAPDVVYQTARGQAATVQLSDGSRVQLAPESRLTIAAAFGDHVRELTLDGEAEFDVHHDATRPFRVRTSTTVTEDIGTRFTVRAYRAESKVLVAVAEGAVTLAQRTSYAPQGGGPQGVLLRVGDTGTLDRLGSVTISRGISVARALVWTSNRLVFENQPLPDVLAMIARWYNLDIRVEDGSVAAHRVTAEFSIQSADQVLQALAAAVDAKVVRDGRGIILRKR